MLLQPLTLCPGDGQVRMQGWVLGTGVPAALRLLAWLLQPPQRSLQLQPRLPGQELPGPLSGGEIRVSMCAQVSWGQQRGDPVGTQGLQPDLGGGSHHGRVCPFGWARRHIPAGLSIPVAPFLVEHQCCPKRNISLMPAESIDVIPKSGHPWSHSPG